MKIAYLAITEQQEKTAGLMQNKTGGTLYQGISLKEAFEEAFETADVIVCVMAAGIVVRMIAPLLRGKDKDPAVIVTDPCGRYIVSLLSGHLGGANAFAAELAKITGGQTVITTATDNAGIKAFDLIAKERQLKIENLQILKYISAAALKKEDVNVVIDPFYRADGAEKTLYLRPSSLCLGIGCRRDTDPECMRSAFEDFCMTKGIDPELIANVATISLKAKEAAIHRLAMSLGLALTVIPDEMIKNLDFERVPGGPIEHSAFVEKTTGVGSVAEACAFLGACQMARSRYQSRHLKLEEMGRLLIKKTKYQGITFALAEYKKQIVL